MKITRRQLSRFIRELATPEPMAQDAMIQLPGSITKSHRASDMPYKQVAAKTGDKPDRSWLTGHEYNARAEEMISQIHKAYDRFNRSWKGGGPKTQVQGWEAWPEVRTAQQMVAGERDHATLQHIYNWTHKPGEDHWKNGELMFPELFTAEADKRYGKTQTNEGTRLKITRRHLSRIIREEVLRERGLFRRGQAEEPEPEAAAASSGGSQLQQLQAKEAEAPSGKQRKIYSVAFRGNVQVAASAANSQGQSEHPGGRSIGVAVEGGKYYSLWEW